MSNHNFKKFYLVVSAAVLSSLIVTGCGKKGPPIAPEGSINEFPAIYPADE